MSTPYLYHEVQDAKPWWMYLIIGPLVVFSAWSFVQQIIFGKPFGNNPAPDFGVWLIFLACGIGLPWLFWAGKQVITFDGKNISSSYVPFWKTTFAWDQVEKYYPREFNAMRDFWGWGIRYGLRKGSTWVMAYVYFDETRGVQFELANGRRILIGSKKTDEFLQALMNARL
ncbi:MAG: hypothetical protein PHY34_06160 [Patescibacteria group bacterium]|nr:hypothetical protein [Patescibacteria group bacterium]MDD5715780.1 hypothetical protein [Patescibacteria group bacterium]